MIDLSKAKKGDKVKFRCGGEAVISGRFYGVRLGFEGYKGDIAYDDDGTYKGGKCGGDLLDIIAIEPAPFDWADVKPGMAVREGRRQEIWWYVGPAFGVDKECFVVTNNKDMTCSDQLHFAFPVVHKLTRAPEHDIEVPT